jgi:hypothetical protein
LVTIETKGPNKVVRGLFPFVGRQH